MLPQEIIRKKRDGQEMSADEISVFIKGVAAGDVTEGQAAAFCMATLLNKMTLPERVALTTAMARSGTVMEWGSANLPGPVLDKHSTGGVGDKVSLMLAPILAACGAYVPMISGRGLGHTGGTLDKMDAIKGYVSQPDRDLFRKVVRQAGCAIIGATPDLAPADRILYAIRDTTATVESLDLITASILSKKLAAGLQGLVMDVKFGSGAFMRDYDDAVALAQSIAHVANGAGLPTVSLLTDMNEVLGTTAGNAVEVVEAVRFLRGEKPESRLYEVTAALCAELLLLGKLATTKDAALEKIATAISSGKAAEHFARMVTALGGPDDFVEHPEQYLATAPVIRPYHARGEGVLQSMDVYAVGMGIVRIGGGRAKPADKIDHAVGLTGVAPIGASVGTKGQPLAVIHARSENDWQIMAETLEKAVTTGYDAPVARPLLRQRIAP